MKALRKVQPTWYTPEENDPQKPARFKVRPLTPSQYESVAVFSDGRLRILPDKWDAVLKMGVIDWEELEGETGPIGFALHQFDVIPELTRMELAGHIISITDLTGEEKKI